MRNKLNRHNVSRTDKKRYVLGTHRDLVILDKVKRLEKLKLNKSDKNVVKLIKTQLKKDWRKYLIAELNKLLRRCR